MNRKTLYNIWCYFRRGHAVYLALGINLLNFVTIQYSLSPLGSVVGNILIFGAIFLMIYGGVAVLIGWFDFSKGSLGVEIELSNNVNPYVRDSADFNLELVKALEAIERGEKVDLDKARSLMKRWGNR